MLRENARFIARFCGLGPNFIESFSRRLCGLEENFDMPVGTCSHGMQARFSLSLMPVLDVDVYLIGAGMPNTSDVDSKRKAGAVLRERLVDTSVVIVSHQAGTLEKFARSAAVLRNGKCHTFDTPKGAARLLTIRTSIGNFRSGT